jgi:Zn/Cd-binding protein ZinT
MKLNQVSKFLDNIEDQEREIKEVYKSYCNSGYILQILKNIRELFKNDALDMFFKYIADRSPYENYEFQVSLWDDYSDTVIKFTHLSDSQGQSISLFLQWHTNSDHIVIINTDSAYYHIYIGVDQSNIFYPKILSCIPSGQQLICGQTLTCYIPSHDCPICTTQLDPDTPDYINWCRKCDMRKENFFKILE